MKAGTRWTDDAARMQTCIERVVSDGGVSGVDADDALSLQVKCERVTECPTECVSVFADLEQSIECVLRSLHGTRVPRRTLSAFFRTSQTCHVRWNEAGKRRSVRFENRSHQ